MRETVRFQESAKCYLLRVMNTCLYFAVRLCEFPWNYFAFTARPSLESCSHISPSIGRRETRMKCHLSRSGLHFGVQHQCSRSTLRYIAHRQRKRGKWCDITKLIDEGSFLRQCFQFEKASMKKEIDNSNISWFLCYVQTGDMKRPGNGIEGAMVCTSLGSPLRPLFYFLDDVSYPQSVLHTELCRKKGLFC